MLLKNRKEENELNNVDLWKRSVLNRGLSKCKVPEAEASLGCL